MNRRMLADLKKWKESPDRMPMLLMGARQTGKSWTLREFGRQEFEHVIVVDFERESPQTQSIEAVIRDWGLDGQRILVAAGMDGRERRPDNTLVVFDEVQRYPRMFMALKYICMEAPECFVVASGSLMGLALEKGTRAPVGYVDAAYMLPMTFYEFLEAAGEDDALDMLESGRWERWNEFSDALARRLREYIMVGGMPGSVDAFLKTGSLKRARNAQLRILNIYDQDFNVHSDNAEFTEKIRHAWRIACMLASECDEDGVFFHKMPDKRASDYYAAVQWLEDCGLIHVCRRCSEPIGILAGNIDIKNYNSFKVFPLDIGLRMATCGYSMDFFSQTAGTSGGALRGKVIEQYVFQQLLVATRSGENGHDPAYYSWKSHGRKYEIDFMIADGGNTVPVEVQRSDSFKSESMNRFQEECRPAKMLRLSPRSPGIEPPVWSLPLAATPSTFDFVRLERLPG